MYKRCIYVKTPFPPDIRLFVAVVWGCFMAPPQTEIRLATPHYWIFKIFPSFGFHVFPVFDVRSFSVCMFCMGIETTFIHKMSSFLPFSSSKVLIYSDEPVFLVYSLSSHATQKTLTKHVEAVATSIYTDRSRMLIKISFGYRKTAVLKSFTLYNYFIRFAQNVKQIFRLREKTLWQNAISNIAANF